MHATGDYILVIDSDDYIELYTVEKMYGKAMEANADIVVCEIKKETMEGYEILVLAPNGVIGNGDNVKDDIINRYVSPSLSCKMIRRSVFIDNEIVWPTADFAEDYVISVEAAYYSRKVASVDEPLYYYCFNQGSFCNTKSEAQILKIYNDFVENFNIIYQFLKDKGVEEKYENGIFLSKVRSKFLIRHLMPNSKYRRMWIKTFPEVNRSFLFGDKYRKPSYRERFWFIAMAIGMYPKFSRVIYSKRLRPRREWMPRWV